MSKTKASGAGGGPTASGGFNFQAAVTAIALAHALRGAPLGWLDGLTADVPISVAAETGGGGDDLRLVLHDGQVAEVQIKKGLRAGTHLWSALLDLAQAVAEGDAQFGLLLVSSTTSRTIRETLATDLIRMGEGTAPKAGELGAQFAGKLKDKGWSSAEVCARLRIVTLSAMTVDDGDVRAARAHLAAACARSRDANAAWDRLYRDAHAMQAGRGRRTLATVAQTLRSSGLALRDDPTGAPSEILERLCCWTANANSQFMILGLDRPLSIDEAYISLAPYVREKDADQELQADLATAVARYHDWDRRVPDRDAAVSDPGALGRFYRLAVVVAGPGTGKSTLLTKVARTYAMDGFAVLKASAFSIARRMASMGQGFEEALFDLALDGSGVSSQSARNAGIADWVVLLDGLDEAGGDQAQLVSGLKRFVDGRPQVRAIVATRPVGYERAALAGWRHYELPSIADGDVDRTLSDLLSHILAADDPRRSRLMPLVEAATTRSGAGKAVLKTPLMIGLAAALFASGGPLGGSRPAFYRAVFGLIDGAPPARAGASASKGVRSRFLDLMGWNLTKEPRLSAEPALEFCARALQDELCISPLAARQMTDQCLEHWEVLGVVEQLRHTGDHAIAFVHKSFGEFAAGRYLATASREVQRDVAANSLRAAAWREPVAFAAALGAAPIILESLSEQGFGEGDGEQRLLSALDILIDTTPPEPLVVAEPILRTAFSASLDDRRGVVGALGMKLTALAPVYPEAMLALAAPLLDHPQAWTRLTALASSFSANPGSRDIRAWVETLADLSEGGASGLDARIRGLRLHDAYGDLLQTFARNLAEKVINDLPAHEAQVMLERTFSGGPFDLVGFIIQMERLIRGRGIKPWWTSALSKAGEVFSGPELVATMRATFETFMRGLRRDEVEASAIDAAESSRPLYALAGLLELIGFGTTALPEIWPLEHFGAEADVRWVWRSVARLAGLPEDALARDAAELEVAIKAFDGEALSLLFRRTPAVDLPAPVWANAATLPPDADLLERALRRRSVLVINAAMHIAGGGGEALCRHLAPRLLADGDGATLWAAAALAGELPREEALNLLFTHACAPLRAGSAYVIEHLRDLAPQDDPRRELALRMALLADEPRAAIAAAVWAAARPLPADLPLLLEAFEHWRKTEAPYPVAGGVVPPSPRAKLLESILTLSPRPWDALVELWRDPRSDVRDVARAELGRVVATREEGRDEIADAVASGELPAALVQTVVDKVAAFSLPQVRRMLTVLDHADSERRFAAVFLLKSAWIQPEDRRAWLDRLRRDPRNEIRERAAKLLHTVAQG